MQFCADKRAEWKARSTRCPCPCPLSPSRIAAPVRSANDGFFVVARPLARSTLFRSRVRCSATRGRPCPRPTRSRAGTWRRSRRHSTVALLALPVFGETMALTIALRLALGCVYESPFSRCLEYWLIHNAAQDLCVSYHLASDRDIVNRQHRGQKASHTRFYTRSRRFFPAATSTQTREFTESRDQTHSHRSQNREKFQKHPVAGER